MDGDLNSTPEDGGSTLVYYDLLGTLAEPYDEEHQERSDWIDPRF